MRRAVTVPVLVKLRETRKLRMWGLLICVPSHLETPFRSFCFKVFEKIVVIRKYLSSITGSVSPLPRMYTSLVVASFSQCSPAGWLPAWGMGLHSHLSLWLPLDELHSFLTAFFVDLTHSRWPCFCCRTLDLLASEASFLLPLLQLSSLST